MTIFGSMQFLEVPINFHFRGEPFSTLPNLTHVWMFLPKGLLLLLPLHGMVLGLVLLHLRWMNASPPDSLLVLTQLALPAPLLGVDSSNMVWQLILPPCSEATPTTPGAGVAKAKMDSLDMSLPVTSLTKTLPAVITLEGFDLIVNCLDMTGESILHGKLDTTCRTLKILLLEMDSLEVFLHLLLLSKPSPAFFALVIYTIMGRLLVLKEIA